MYLASPPDAQTEKALNECKAALSQLSLLWPQASGSELIISSQKTLYAKVPRDGSIYLIKEGTLKCLKNDKVLYYVEEGDLIGFEGSAYDEKMDFFAEFAVSLVQIDPKIFISSDEAIKLWNKFQGSFLNAILQNVANATKSQVLFSPEVKTFSAGEYILTEGAIGKEVCSLIDGIAETIIDGKAVSNIVPDQLFGAVSTLTNSPRLAAVQAVTDCLVVMLTKEQFLTLVDSKPDTFLKLAEDLSWAIVSLNKQVTGLIHIP